MGSHRHRPPSCPRDRRRAGRCRRGRLGDLRCGQRHRTAGGPSLHRRRGVDRRGGHRAGGVGRRHPHPRRPDRTSGTTPGPPGPALQPVVGGRQGRAVRTGRAGLLARCRDRHARPGLDLEQLARDAVDAGRRLPGHGRGRRLPGLGGLHRGGGTAFPSCACRRGPGTTSRSTSGSTATTLATPSTPSTMRSNGRSTIATVNGRFFVNNVSLGVYATIVQQEGYREAKAETSRTAPPRAARPDRPAVRPAVHDARRRRRSTGPSSSRCRTTPTSLAASPDLSQRRRLDTGRLGVFAVTRGHRGPGRRGR